jgi:predicted DNA-binding antitoxin AbrB/MazE fold protein
LANKLLLPLVCITLLLNYGIIEVKGGKRMAQSERVKAIYREGTLQLLEPVNLPEGVEVWVELKGVPQPGTETATLRRAIQLGPTYPTRPQSPETLERLIGLVAVGGDALADSEALYDADRH